MVPHGRREPGTTRPFAQALMQISTVCQQFSMHPRTGPVARAKQRQTPCTQAARVASAQEASTSTPFQQLSAGTARRYVMVSGKGGVGKTSLAASLAVQFAADGHNTLVVSTDPAHSLSDSLDQVTCNFCNHMVLARPTEACNSLTA